MQIYPVPVGLMEVNCYFVWRNQDAAVLIDPGADASRISSELEKNGLTPSAILLTHGILTILALWRS
jgi:glyoxylase-like metal-dependent hydrolase (beta-lactamase superfamily II)